MASTLFNIEDVLNEFRDLDRNEVLENIDASKAAPELFKSLSNLIAKQNDPNKVYPYIVPENVEQIVARYESAQLEFERAQHEFIRRIDEHLHRDEDCIFRDMSKSEVEIDETILKICPDFLSSKNRSDQLPIHRATRTRFEADNVAMLAKHGMKHDVGGKDSRGGLLVRTGQGFNVLQRIRNVETFEKLANSDPPLFFKQDILDYDLLHFAVKDENMARAKWLISMCPSALYAENECSCSIPLGCCRNNTEMIKFCLEEAIKYDPTHPSIGGLFHKDNKNTFAIQKFNDDDEIFKAIAQVISQHKHLPILHKVIEHTPALFDKITAFCPHASIIRDKSNRLPIHLALERGMKTSIGLSSLMSANLQQLGEMDPVTKFCPSALAALSPACDVNTIYQLIRAHPNHAEVVGKKNKHSGSSIPDSKALHLNKRRKKE